MLWCGLDPGTAIHDNCGPEPAFSVPFVGAATWAFAGAGGMAAREQSTPVLWGRTDLR